VPIFSDVFCEAGVFDRTQTARVLTAGARPLPGVNFHLKSCSIEKPSFFVGDPVRSVFIRNSVSRSRTTLGSHHFADARALIDAGAAVALATDFNPGSAPMLALPLVMALACRYQHLTPAEALNAVTLNAAHAIDLGDRLGSLEAGKQADVLIVNAPDYRHLVYWLGANLVEGVVKRGEMQRV